MMNNAITIITSTRQEINHGTFLRKVTSGYSIEYGSIMTQTVIIY